MQHRRVVTEGFARGCRCDHHDVSAGQRVIDRFGLVGVELLDSARRQRLRQSPVERLRKRRELRGDRRQPPHRGHMKIRGIRPIDRAASEAIERRIQRVFSVRTPRGQHGAASYQRGEQMAN